MASVGQTSPQRMQDGSHQPRRMSRTGVKRPSTPVLPRSAQITPVVQEAEQGMAQLERMHEEEAEHGENAVDAGAAELPPPIKQLMRLTAKVMTRTAYWL